MDNTERSVILFPQKRCCACGEPSARRWCSRSCRMIWVEFYTLDFVLANARWAGAPSQEEARAEYLRNRMWAAVRRLGHSEELLVEVLVEIISDL